MMGWSLSAPHLSSNLSAQRSRQNFTWERNEKRNENLMEQVYKIPDTPIEQL
jgi:hypothetical protein